MSNNAADKWYEKWYNILGIFISLCTIISIIVFLKIPPTVEYFTATPSIIDSGTTSELSWNVKNAESVTIDHEIGSVLLSGSKSVRPKENTTYTLIARWFLREVTATIDVQVIRASPQAPTSTGSIAPQSPLPTPASLPQPRLNKTPIITDLASSLDSPQKAGIQVVWTATTSDPENDPLVYKFLLRGTPVIDWTPSNTWTWEPTETDIGSNLIEVQIRDGKHAGPEGYDTHSVAQFTINPWSEESRECYLEAFIDSISISTPEVGQNVIFRGHANACPGVKIRTYGWSSDKDGDLYSGPMSSFSRKFKNPGTHKVTFKVIDENNKIAYAYIDIEVLPTK